MVEKKTHREGCAFSLSGRGMVVMDTVLPKLYIIAMEASCHQRLREQSLLFLLLLRLSWPFSLEEKGRLDLR